MKFPNSKRQILVKNKKLCKNKSKLCENIFGLNHKKHLFRKSDFLTACSYSRNRVGVFLLRTLPSFGQSCGQRRSHGLEILLEKLWLLQRRRRHSTAQSHQRRNLMKERIHVSSILIVLLFFIYLPPVFLDFFAEQKKIHAAAILTIT